MTAPAIVPRVLVELLAELTRACCRTRVLAALYRRRVVVLLLLLALVPVAVVLPLVLDCV